MFTKYNNVSIPKNYSGSRFHQGNDDTEMKTHRATESIPSTNITKTSVSPYFRSNLIKESSLATEDSEDSSFEVPYDASMEEKAEIIDTPADKDSDSSTGNLTPNDEEGALSRLFKNIKNDDLLLLALILLLSKDGADNSFDAIVILALLLMYH